MYRRKSIDPRVIGSFVVGAIILIVAGLLFFGPGGFLAETRKYVVYFDSSVKGLNVGSPVRFRGVKIGQVKNINVRLSPSNFEFHIPVLIEIEPSRIEVEGTKQGLLDALKSTVQGGDPMTSLVDKGLRAQLQLDSLVTGQLYINFDMLPETPIVLTGDTNNYPQLPSASSSLDELTKTFEDLPLKELTEKLTRSATGFEKITNSPSLHNALARLDNTTAQLNKLLETLNEQVPPLIAAFKQSLQQTETTISRIDRKIDPLTQNIEQTLQAAQATINRIDSKVDPLTEQFSQSMQSFKVASGNTSATMQHIKALASDNSRTMEQLTLTLQEINRAARSVRDLSTELERDPQILLRGRAAGGTN